MSARRFEAVPWFDVTGEPSGPQRFEPARVETGRSLDACALGFSFRLTLDDEALEPALRDLFADLLVPEHMIAVPEHEIALVGNAGGRYLLAGDGFVARRDLPSREVPGMLSWLVNQGVIHHAGPLLLFHAAVVAHHDEGVLIVGESGSGKSTLAGALVADGLDYLSDEVGALDAASGRLLAYPKTLSLDPRSIELLDLRGAAPAALAALEGREPQLPAGAIRAGSVVPACLPRIALFLDRQPGARSELRPLRRSEAMIRLVANSFNLVEHPQRHFPACVELCRRIDSYELLTGELGSTRGLVGELLAGDGHRLDATSARS